MVTEQLEWDDVENTLEAVDGLWDTNRLRLLRHGRVIFIADDDRLRLACGNLGKGILHLRVKRVTRHDDNHRHVLINECEWAVLELSGKDTLGVHIADLLDLERALETRRVLQSTTKDEQRARVRELGSRKLLERLVVLEHLYDLAWQSMQTVNDLLAALSQGHAVLRKLDGHHEKYDIL